MSITLRIPTALRAFTDGQKAVGVNGATVGEALGAFADAHADLRAHLYEEDGSLRSFINLYVGELNIRQTGGLDTPVKDGDVITLVPAIAGGRG